MARFGTVIIGLRLLRQAVFSPGIPRRPPQNPLSDARGNSLPEASGSVVMGDDLIQIDASHADQGYIMVKTLSPQHRRLKLKVIKDGEEYPYDIDQDGNYITYPPDIGQRTV